MVEVTTPAQEALKNVMEEKNVTGPLRFFLQQGCGGGQLALAVDEQRDTDEVYDVGGYTYVVDKGLAIQTGSLKLDYVDDGQRQGFLISSDRPLEMGGGCGCGSGCSC